MLLFVTCNCSFCTQQCRCTSSWYLATSSSIGVSLTCRFAVGRHSSHTDCVSARYLCMHTDSHTPCCCQIVPRKQKMSDVFTSETTEHEMKLQLRALDDSLAESQRLNKLVTMAGLDPGLPLFMLTLATSLSLDQKSEIQCVNVSRCHVCKDGKPRFITATAVDCGSVCAIHRVLWCNVHLLVAWQLSLLHKATAAVMHMMGAADHRGAAHMCNAEHALFK